MAEKLFIGEIYERILDTRRGVNFKRRRSQYDGSLRGVDSFGGKIFWYAGNAKLFWKSRLKLRNNNFNGGNFSTNRQRYCNNFNNDRFIQNANRNCAAISGGAGIPLMQENPNVIPALIVGTMAGVFFFKGIAVGPLIAAGFTYFVMAVFEYFK